MLLLSLEPSSQRDHNNREVIIITHKSAPPNLIKLQTCSWVQVLMAIMSNDTSEIKGQWKRWICNTKLILTHAELLGKNSCSSCRLNPSTVPLTQSPIFKSPHCKFFTLTWIDKKPQDKSPAIYAVDQTNPIARMTFWKWGAGTKSPRRMLKSLLPSLGTWYKIRHLFDATGTQGRNGQNCFTFLFMWILPVAITRNLLTPELF